MFKSLAAAFILAASFASLPAHANNAAFCSLSSSSGSESCDYFTFAQCQAALSGSSTGVCYRNPHNR
jgi:uncharacterized protein DUF3551